MAKLKIVKTETGNEFLIEKGIPLLPVMREGRPPKYPVDKLAVGDSFAFSAKLKDTVGGCAHQWGKKNGRKFALRAIGDGKARCWRIK